MRSTVTNAPSQPVRNIHPRPYPRVSSVNPYAYFSSSGTVGTHADVTVDDGSMGIRLTRVDTTALALYNSRGTSALWQVANGNMNVGETWTIMCTIKTNVNSTVTVNLGTGTGSANLAGTSLIVNTVANVPQNVRYTVTFSAAHIASGNGFLKWNTLTTGSAVGDWMEISKVAVVRGNYTGPFIAGDLPSSKWDGTANASSSIGYPFTLDSLIGGRYVRLDGVATANLGIPIGAFEDRALYTVYDVTGATNTSTNIITVHGAGTGSGIRVQTTSSLSAMGTRADTINGVSNLNSTLTNARTPGRKCVSLRTRAGITRLDRRSNVSAAAAATQNIVTGDGMTTNMDFYTVLGPETIPVTTYMVRGDIDDTTDFAIMKVLADRHNFTNTFTG